MMITTMKRMRTVRWRRTFTGLKIIMVRLSERSLKMRKRAAPIRSSQMHH